MPVKVGDKLSQIQLNHLNATFLFEEHGIPILDYFFPRHKLANLYQEPHLEFHCENPYLVQQLRQLLPFGHYLITAQQNSLISNSTKCQLCLQAHTQFLYWYLQWVKKLSQCLAIFERLTQRKSSKLCNNMNIIYDLLGHLGFWINPRSCDLRQNWWNARQNKTPYHWDSFFTLYFLAIHPLYQPKLA